MHACQGTLARSIQVHSSSAHCFFSIIFFYYFKIRNKQPCIGLHFTSLLFKTFPFKRQFNACVMQLICIIFYVCTFCLWKTHALLRLIFMLPCTITFIFFFLQKLKCIDIEPRIKMKKRWREWKNTFFKWSH